MRHALAAIAMLAVASAAAAQNVQPISVSLVECASIFDELATLGEQKGRSGKDVAKMRRAATIFRDEGAAQAESEGIADAGAHVIATTAEMDEKWQGRFGKVFLFHENKEWISYCEALGRDRGLLPIED